MRSLLQAFTLSLRDYRHEALLSACSVLGLSAVLAPLLVLLGVQHGIISSMTEQLLNDPRTLEIIPVGSGKYDARWFEQLTELPGSAFILPQTRSIAATVTLVHDSDSHGHARTSAVTPIIASGSGDPVLYRWGQPDVGWNTTEQNGAAISVSTSSAVGGASSKSFVDNAACMVVEAILSESLARKLSVRPGDRLECRVDRVRDGKRESASLPLNVLSVLPPEAQVTDLLFVPLELMVATEDYRDGRAVPFLGWGGTPVGGDATGNVSPTGGSSNPTDRHNPDEPAEARALSSREFDAYAQSIRSDREYASFRMYAADLDDVTPLWHWFQNRHVEVYVKSAEIETVKSLDRAFSIVFGLIAGAAVFGFAASTASSALAGVRRKSRSLGIMRLIGFTRGGIMLFPLAQSLVTGLLGSFLAFALYAGVAYSIDTLFSASLPGGTAVCSLPFSYAALVLALVLLLSAVSCLAAARQATIIEPSEVIRDV